MRLSGKTAPLGAWTAVLGALALFVQTFMPLAAAQAAAPGAPQAICIATGVKTLPGGPAHHSGFAGLPCAACVFSSVAATLSPSPAAPTPVTYAVSAPPFAAASVTAAPPARAPPRPPGQAPPAVLSA